jgi:hypothetical protein
MPTTSNNPLLKTLKQCTDKISALLHSSRGKDLLLFTLFLCVSYVFWIIMTLNEDTQRDLNVPLEITDTPEGITFISDVPGTITVSVRDKGTSLVNYVWGNMPTLKIRYNEFTHNSYNERIVCSQQELNMRVRSLFGANAQVMSLRPDSLSFVVTDQPGRPAKVVPCIDAQASIQSVISGPITVKPDSVLIYSAKKLPITMQTVSTMEISRTELTDTLTLEVRIKPISGARAVPDRVTVTIPVEPLIAKQRTVPITLKGAPAENSVLLFPSTVTVTYLVPMSMYNSEVGVITVMADYNHRSSSTAKVPLTLGSTPDFCHNPTLSTDSVDFLIEQQTSLHTSNSQQ